MNIPHTVTYVSQHLSLIRSIYVFLLIFNFTNCLCSNATVTDYNVKHDDPFIQSKVFSLVVKERGPQIKEWKASGIKFDPPIEMSFQDAVDVSLIHSK